MSVKAFLEITMTIPNENRLAAGKIYNNYMQPFLSQIKGTVSFRTNVPGCGDCDIRNLRQDNIVKNRPQSVLYKMDL